ncbi:hypothetical protein [Floridanema evergladense]|uniref:Uncharacterized protein n=1 Tax=Floridaenema evergladense BLCC-F167 TaxID=3153639 RepID=A0ABV4WNP4_9CYAN
MGKRAEERSLSLQASLSLVCSRKASSLIRLTEYGNPTFVDDRSHLSILEKNWGIPCQFKRNSPRIDRLRYATRSHSPIQLGRSY